MNDAVIGRAMGVLIKEERQRTDKLIESLRVDETGLLKGILCDLLSANLQAINEHCGQIMHKRSVVLEEGRGGPSRAVKMVTESR